MVTRVKKSVGKTPTKKAAKKATKKTAVKKSAVKKTRAKVDMVTEKVAPVPASTRRMFTPGSDLELAFNVMLEGGTDRRDVVHKVAAAFEEAKRTTVNGGPKPVSTIINQVLHRAHTFGYGIVSTWSLQRVESDAPAAEAVADSAVKPAKAKKATKKASKKRAIKKVAKHA